MKYFLVLLTLILFVSNLLFSQVSVNENGNPPHPSAALEVNYPDKGFLPPRMTHEQLSNIANPAEGLMVFCTDCGPGGTGVLAVYSAGTWHIIDFNCLTPYAPNQGSHSPGLSEITWNWDTVPDATGYKWNTLNEYNTATDLGNVVSYTESSLDCDSIYTRHIWAYNGCGNSEAALLTQSTTVCPWVCGNSFTISHVAGNVAPVSKTVTYGTAGNIIGATSLCWITSNLGADHQASSATDATEASAGWYWQFNRQQGYKHDGSTRTPNTTWIDMIYENSDWTVTNDPCTIELGGTWRLPTEQEWYNIDLNGGWTDPEGPWDSDLKIHPAGYLEFFNGSIEGRGMEGNYWSSVQHTLAQTLGYNLFICPGYSAVEVMDKSSGFSVRCVTSCDPPPAPVQGTHIPSQDEIIWNWNAVTGASGYKWSTGYDYYTAQDLGNVVTFTESGLDCNTAYSRYLWAYNGCGASAPVSLTQTTSNCSWACGDSLIVVHTAGSVAPVNKTVHYGTVTDIPGEPTKCWITNNLGSDHQATSVYDLSEASAGWYWQFNLPQGYKHDGTTRTPGSEWISTIYEWSDWTSANDPCTIELGTGWRIPTSSEWGNVDNSGGWSFYFDSFGSALKIHPAGYLDSNTGDLTGRGSDGNYWSSNMTDPSLASHLSCTTSVCLVTASSKTFGYTLRCLKN